MQSSAPFLGEKQPQIHKLLDDRGDTTEGFRPHMSLTCIQAQESLRAVPFERLWAGMSYALKEFNVAWSEHFCASVGGSLENVLV